jgi:23S rRNA pseudouridine2605 synthase
MRLVKLVANAGVASRRASERLIAGGRVQVNAETIVDPAREVTEDDEITVDGVPIALPAAGERDVYAVNKPAGVVSTASDPQRRPTVVSLVPSPRRLYPIGRLDIDATGLVLLTNDGELAHRLTHPSFEVPKTYRAVVAGGRVGEAALRLLRDGVVLEDGPTAPARARLLAPDTIELTIHEGRNRQVKRMCEAVGHRVRALHRTAFGPLALDDLGLGLGEARLLDDARVAALSAAAATSARPAPPASPSAPGRRFHG